MNPEEMIALEEFCSSHQLEISFIHTIEEHGLIEVFVEDHKSWIAAAELPRLELIVRLHQELDVNPEGIDAINNLLTRIELMQTEITRLKNRLSVYE